MTTSETPAAPRNTEEQLVGRACCPQVGDRFYRWNDEVKTIDVMQVGKHHVGYTYDGPNGTRDVTVSPEEWAILVRRTFDNGCDFVPANTPPFVTGADSDMPCQEGRP